MPTPLALVRRLSPRLLVYAASAEPPAVSDGGLALPQLDSAAFGDGTHPTTQLCARTVDLLCRQRGSPAVLDVGTGSGILARIARARGARLVVATDIHPIALRSAEANAQLDAHALDILVTSVAPDSWGPRFDLVVANILEAPLLELAPVLARALAPGADLLLSGFTPMQAPALRVAFTALGLTCHSESTLDGWVLLQLRRSTPTR
jgi:ribosomal protein L11 methyltransferase